MKTFFLLIILFFLQTLKSENKEYDKEYTFVYEIYDIRFCYLTPDPFLCKKCLKKDEQIARKISFDKQGRPYRENLCLPYKKKYLH